MNDEYIQIEKALLKHKENVDLIPSNLDLSALEMSLVNAMSREYTMKNCISSLKENYDYIIIDCQPSLGIITINALACADSVIIPVQSHFLAARGMTQLIQTINKIKRQINPQLTIDGILLTLVDKRTRLAKDIRCQLHENYSSRIRLFNTQIPFAIKTAESSAKGESVFLYDEKGVVAQAYLDFAKEVLNIERCRDKNATTKVR